MSSMSKLHLVAVENDIADFDRLTDVRVVVDQIQIDRVAQNEFIRLVASLNIGSQIGQTSCLRRAA